MALRASSLDPAPTRFAHSAGLQEILAVEDSAKDDHVLTGKVHVAKQFPK